MASESASPGTPSVASALASGTTSPSIGASPVNPKSAGLLEEAVPMVIVQQFIQDNEEKGMPVNQTEADLQRKQEEIKVTKELKNEERKRARLRAKAKQLSAEDLVQVLALRATASAAKKSKQKRS